jgi:hypothetical protein
MGIVPKSSSGACLKHVRFLVAMSRKNADATLYFVFRATHPKAHEYWVKCFY